jgi:hypothetical protein
LKIEKLLCALAQLKEPGLEQTSLDKTMQGNLFSILSDSDQRLSTKNSGNEKFTQTNDNLGMKG